MEELELKLIADIPCKTLDVAHAVVNGKSAIIVTNGKSLVAVYAPTGVQVSVECMEVRNFRESHGDAKANKR